MPPKGGNAKKETGRAKKAENEETKKAAAAADKERQEAAKWDDGPKKGGAKKGETAAEKRAAELARKAENARLLALEEADAPAKAKPAKPAAKKAPVAPKPAGPGAIAAGGGLPASGSGSEKTTANAEKEEGESFAATGIDNALDLLDVVTAKMDKASVGQQAAGLEAHPERRFKAAFEAYKERELPELRKERPGLRLQQYQDVLYKQFQKSPDNPFNQVTVSHDASKEERLAALDAKKTDVERRLRDRT